MNVDAWDIKKDEYDYMHFPTEKTVLNKKHASSCRKGSKEEALTVASK